MYCCLVLKRRDGEINPNYLVKDELEFEVKLRGEVPAIGVVDLRKKLRSLVRRGGGPRWDVRR